MLDLVDRLHAAAFSARMTSRSTVGQTAFPDELRESQRKGLEQMLYTEVVGLGSWTESVRGMLTYGIDLSCSSGVGHPRSLHFALKRCQEDWLPVSTALQDKLYLLKQGHGEVLSQLIGSSIGIRAFAKEIDEQFNFLPRSDDDAEDRWVFHGDSAELDVLWRRVDEVAATAAHLSSKFISVVTRVKIH